MPADLLQTLEASGQNVEVRFDTAVGRGKVWLNNGRLADARMGHHRHEAAVFCLLGLREGVFEVQSMLVPPKTRMNSRVGELVGQWKARANQWRELAARAVPLDSILELANTGKTSDPSEAAMVALVDGQRTALEIIDESGLDAVQGLRTIVRLCDKAAVRVAPGSSAPPSSGAPDTKRWTPSVGERSAADPVRARSRTAYSLASSERTVVSTHPPKPRQPPAETLSSRDARPSPNAPHEASGQAPGPQGMPSRPVARHPGGVRSPAPVISRPPATGEVDSEWTAPSGNETPPPTAQKQCGEPSHEGRRDSLLLPPPLSIPGEPAEVAPTSAERGPETGNDDDPEITFHETELTLEDLRLIAEAEAAVPDGEESAPQTSEAPVDESADAQDPGSEDRAAHGDVERFVGRYEVLCRIGRGGMGSVYLCRVTTDAGFRRLFALKVLHASLSDSPDASKLFLQEASLLGWLNHPNVVGVVDAAIYQGQPYLVMDYVEGCSFHQLLKRSPELRSPRLVVSIVLEALAGLHAAHTLADEDGEPLQIVHCDISPDNLLVGVNGVCRLSDFGVARVRANAYRAEVTRGKPGYLSPEQVLEKAVDCRSDVFSMGAVLYNTLTGTRVFDGDTLEKVLAAVLEAPIRPPSEVGLCPPPCLDTICLRALERNPAKRYQTANDMLLDLRAAAIRNDLLALPAEIAGWVDEAIGEDLRMRRLACLDASRRSKEARPHPLTPSEIPPPLPVAVPTLPPDDSEPPSQDMLSQTIVLPARSGNAFSRSLLMAAAALVVLFVGLMIGWPDFAARIFTIDTGGFSTWGPADTRPKTMAVPPAIGSARPVVVADTPGEPVAPAPSVDTEAGLEGSASPSISRRTSPAQRGGAP